MNLNQLINAEVDVQTLLFYVAAFVGVVAIYKSITYVRETRTLAKNAADSIKKIKTEAIASATTSVQAEVKKVMAAAQNYAALCERVNRACNSLAVSSVKDKEQILEVIGDVVKNMTWTPCSETPTSVKHKMSNLEFTLAAPEVQERKILTALRKPSKYKWRSTTRLAKSLGLTHSSSVSTLKERLASMSARKTLKYNSEKQFVSIKS